MSGGALSSGEVRYRRLAGLLRERILRGEFAEDEPLPTELSLAEEHNMSRQTVRRAYLDLVNEGLVYRVPGRGTFVTSRKAGYGRPWASVTDLMDLTLDTELELVEPISGAFDPYVAERLQLATRSLYSLGYRRLHRGVVFSFTRVYLPPAFGRALEHIPDLVEVGQRSRTTIIGLIESRGTTIAEADQTITAVPASPDTAGLLECVEGTALLRMERLYIDPSGTPIELSVSEYLPEHYSHRLRLGRRSVHHPQP